MIKATDQPKVNRHRADPRYAEVWIFGSRDGSYYSGPLTPDQLDQLALDAAHMAAEMRLRLADRASA